MGYIKLSRGVEDGTVFFTLPKYSDKQHALHIPEGAVIPIQWADGSRTQAQIAYHTSIARVYGYKVKQSVAGVLTSCRGQTTWLPLDQVMVLEESFLGVCDCPK